MHVEALKKEHAGAKRFCLRAVWTKLSWMFLLHQKETKGLSEKMEDVSGLFFRT